MADITVKRHEDFEAIFGGGFRRVRAGLGVTSFGIAVMDLPPNFQHYPTHDQSHDGQEEVYSALSGSATLEVGGEEHTLEPGVWARVGPDEKRKIVAGPEGARILAIGGTPGKIYEPPEYSIEGTSVHEEKIKAKMREEAGREEAKAKAETSAT
jgi:mannose-6-phosphate isomerase-like protein (cupin superfamily)